MRNFTIIEGLLLVESASRSFQPGKGHSRGLLCDCKTSHNLHEPLFEALVDTLNSFTSRLIISRHGFILPADQIIPNGEEMWAGLEVEINALLNL